jgi:hypothetical protein
MSGLNLMGNVKVAANTSGYSSDQNASSATEMAFGPGYTDPGTPSSKGALLPNDPFGIGLWAGVAALGLLLVIRHSLPR